MDFTLLNQAFHRLGVAESAPENHGVLCGLLCARGLVPLPDWLSLMRGAPADPDAPADTGSAFPAASEEDRAAVTALYEDTVDGLRQADRLFSPLLPGDDEPLEVRSEAMADWCSGFLYGLGAGGIQDLSVLPEDVREIAGDIAEISHAGAEADGGEEDEAAYFELVEYLRAGVTLVFEILESERAEAAPDRIIH